MIALKKILSVILSFILLFPSYLFSFLPSKADTDFTIEAITAVAVSGIENRPAKRGNGKENCRRIF